MWVLEHGPPVGTVTAQPGARRSHFMTGSSGAHTLGETSYST